MFVITLGFSENRDRAGKLMDGHKMWLRKGFEEGVFLVAGSLAAGKGGGILASKTSRAELEARLAQDPFVAEKVVSAEIIEITPSLTDARLEFLIQES
tara:strand:- start:1175 stop:1468 length:294 start_codon:yes stop_codon:yes gene_type:complete